MIYTNSNIEALNTKQILNTNFSTPQTFGIYDLNNLDLFMISRLGFSIWEAKL